MKYPFEATIEEILAQPDQYIDAVFSCLESEFLVMPKGTGFIDYPVFEKGYEALKAATAGFSDLKAERIVPVIKSMPISFVVLRAMLGFTPSEWGYITTRRTGIAVSQGYARTFDRRVRMNPEVPLKPSGMIAARLEALVKTACILLCQGVPDVQTDQIHRLDKADTKRGLDSIRHLAAMGAPYAMLLYERFLGRPFAGHRDSVSELVGDSLESAIEDVLSRAGISYRKTKRAEKIEGFDQTPDFIIPSEFNPQVVIEAKITEDDGTARDKVTRILRLVTLSHNQEISSKQRYEVIACIGGRGFGERREDMRRLIESTHGKVFTLKMLDRMLDHSRLREFRTR
ncbi:MAG: hypothetical protein CVU61_13205 [Deltaproteobacteria bacterium HGW-Deltaproteobacteria-19]|jgi:hypothetical protein|nr:MAG: hypothetical protein CVU61_13205 [Deltaproteobacteria bacterium HGW-Deltaproteobacteria-19]